MKRYDPRQMDEKEIRQLVQELSAVLVPIINEVWKSVKTIVDVVLYHYPNRRVLHLALYHPKERVRKKNIHRIMRWVEKGGQYVTIY